MRLSRHQLGTLQALNHYGVCRSGPRALVTMEGRAIVPEPSVASLVRRGLAARGPDEDALAVGARGRATYRITNAGRRHLRAAPRRQ